MVTYIRIAIIGSFTLPLSAHSHCPYRLIHIAIIGSLTLPLSAHSHCHYRLIDIAIIGSLTLPLSAHLHLIKFIYGGCSSIALEIKLEPENKLETKFKNTCWHYGPFTLGFFVGVVLTRGVHQTAQTAKPPAPHHTAPYNAVSNLCGVVWLKSLIRKFQEILDSKGVKPRKETKVIYEDFVNTKSSLIKTMHMHHKPCCLFKAKMVFMLPNKKKTSKDHNILVYHTSEFVYPRLYRDELQISENTYYIIKVENHLSNKPFCNKITRSSSLILTEENFDHKKSKLMLMKIFTNMVIYELPSSQSPLHMHRHFSPPHSR
ncbi:hypothetical protein LXL04_005195 [Taraxacum kok-saghyz]